MGCNASNTAGQQAAQPSESKGHGLDKSQFIHHSNKKITEIYEVEKKKLGEGSYGSVTKGKHRKTKEVRAVKTIAKSQMKNIDRFMQEIAILKMMDHPNIIKLFETFEDARNIYLVMELCIGGELFDKIIEEGHLTEVNAAQLMKQIIHAVYYMHSESVCHRDLKPENILMDSMHMEADIKIADFGLAVELGFEGYHPEESMRMKKARIIDGAYCGSPISMAPEVSLPDALYGPQCDIWSVGCLAHELVCGHPPFTARSAEQLFELIRKSNGPNFQDEIWAHVSKEGVDLVRLCLQKKPEDRPSAKEALNHAWFVEAPDVHMHGPHETITLRVSQMPSRAAASTPLSEFGRRASDPQEPQGTPSAHAALRRAGTCSASFGL
mmetsp:Transcript_37172/g.118294  ORF Transcript_37172/g.118294 Transcript_37172/m.118294 type:complete len:381 (-) Transcript_37172:81-1223(-)